MIDNNLETCISNPSLRLESLQQLCLPNFGNKHLSLLILKAEGVEVSKVLEFSDLTQIFQIIKTVYSYLVDNGMHILYGPANMITDNSLYIIKNQAQIHEYALMLNGVRHHGCIEGQNNNKLFIILGAGKDNRLTDDIINILFKVWLCSRLSNEEWHVCDTFVFESTLLRKCPSLLISYGPYLAERDHLR